MSDREKIGDDPRFKIKNVKIGEVKNEKTIIDGGKFQHSEAQSMSL